MLQQHKIRFTVFSFKNMHTHTHIYSHTLHFVNSINNNKNNNNNSSNKKKNQEKILAKSFWTWCSYYSLLIQTALTRSQPECIHLWYEPSPQKDGYTESARIIHYHRFHMSEGVRAFAIISGCMKKKKCSRDLMDMSLCDYHWFNWQIKLAEYFSTDGFHWKCERSRAPRETLRSI